MSLQSVLLSCRDSPARLCGAGRWEGSWARRSPGTGQLLGTGCGRACGLSARELRARPARGTGHTGLTQLVSPQRVRNGGSEALRPSLRLRGLPLWAATQLITQVVDDSARGRMGPLPLLLAAGTIWFWVDLMDFQER